MPRHIPLPGPVLFARHISASEVQAGVLLTTEEDASAPGLAVPDGRATEPERVYRRFGAALWTAEITLPRDPNARYLVEGREYPVETRLDGDCRLAFVSCNGREHGEKDWKRAPRNEMWRRLGNEHRASPLGLLIQGGDQIYADGVKTCHPDIKRWLKAPPRRKHDHPLTDEMAETAERWLLHAYLELFAMEEIGFLLARVPTFSIWDDHDIFDGYGSQPRAMQTSAVGQMLFRNARRMFRMFQLGRDPDGETPPEGFTRALSIPGLTLAAPDLRSSRTRDSVMNAETWAAFEAILDGLPPGEPLFVVSSVPALGPRLSWAEAAMVLVPKIQRYEDDLRDQWQSRAHRADWQRFLRLFEREISERDRPVTFLSGEIHLATRAEMRLPDGRVIHQLVSSGIAHPSPHWLYPRGLGLLASMGEAPLPGRPISLHPLPGRKRIYTAERNYLLLIRENGAWSAVWETENHGPTGALPLPAIGDPDAATEEEAA